MGGLASSALYLATSFASGPPAVVPVDPPLVTTPAPRPYVIVNLPMAASAAAASLGTAIGDALQSDPGELPPPGAERSSAEDAAALDAAVVAAHEARIRDLRERIAALKAERAAATELAPLGARLRRAEAARQVATARIALAACDGACAPEPAGLAGRAPKRSSTKLASRLAAATIIHTPAAVQATVPPRTASPAIPRQQRAVATARDGMASTVTGTATDSSDGMARARALLARARAALDAPPREATIQLAGLWQWDGSEQWSLPARTT